jgi:hypothetical protein
VRTPFDRRADARLIVAILVVDLVVVLVFFVGQDLLL